MRGQYPKLPVWSPATRRRHQQRFKTIHKGHPSVEDPKEDVIHNTSYSERLRFIDYNSLAHVHLFKYELTFRQSTTALSTWTSFNQSYISLKPV
jgi:hypothetical protein